MGADGVLIPRTETMEQVETAIRSLRMPPLDKKGVGGRACLRAGETIADFNNNRLLFLQMESPQGIDLLDEMLTKYGDQIAGVIVGPNDLESSMGYPSFDCPKPDDTYDNYIRKCIRISNAHGKSCGIFMTSDAAMRKWYGEGMNIFWVNTEFGMLTNEVKRVKGLIEEL
jgi:2-keto-3-deoxy-L-rhamnonate aldolase RhmA